MTKRASWRVFGGLMVAFSIAVAACNSSPTGGAGNLALEKLAGGASEQERSGGASDQDLAGSRGEPDAGVLASAAEAAANRAYPLDTVPLALTQAARQSFENIDQDTEAGGRRHGTWSLLGPSTAFMPGVLTFTGADYVTSGRITSLAISPRCNAEACQLWVGAAGGGIWKTNDALSSKPHWHSVSDGLTTNAIGTIVVDPTDPTGDTLYVGTGEPNASGDSEAGLGLFKSTNGGEKWTLVEGSFNVSKSRAISSVVIDPRNPNVIYIGTTRAVRGVSSVTGGSTTTDPNGQPLLGLYRSADGGATWARIWNGSATLRGVNHVELDPSNPDLVYATAFQEGIWRGTASSAFEQVFVPLNTTNNAQRTEFALTTKDGHTRIYVGDGENGSSVKSHVYRTDNANQSAALVLASWKDLTSDDRLDPRYATTNYCTGQCWYDNVVATPSGQPDTVFVLGSYQYSEYGLRSNSRSILRSKTAGDADPAHNNRTFTDLSWDATSASKPNGVHPDQHALAFVPGNPDIWFEGSDGGLIRSSGTYTDASGQCAQRPLSPKSLVVCNRVLSEIPTKLFSLNAGLATLQFQSLSVNPKSNGREIMGGTQDNGTWLFTGNRTNWNQSIYGDGGQSGFNAATPQIRFNTFFGAATDENFQGGDPTKWVVTSGPLNPLTNAENVAFYMPIIADPMVGGTQFAGLQHVWRTQDNGGNQAYLEANCPEFTAAFNDPNCGDWVAIGNDLTGSGYGADRAGQYVVALARGSDNSTLWAATRTGRVFVSHNADAGNPASVVFKRIDNLDASAPGRFVSGIAVDPNNSNHAWISYSGYNAGTPATPGHVFEVTYNPGAGTATFNNLEVESINGDIPVTGIVRDDARGDLYVSTDFGVLTWSQEDSPHWAVAGGGLPRVEVAGLTISPSSRTLYAATHGRGAWVLNLRPAH